MLLLLVALAFGAGFVDTALGMGYGTVLGPLLLAAGYRLPEAVPALLLSQVVAGLVGARFHHANGNASFGRNSAHLRVATVLIGAGLVGGAAGPWLAGRVPEFVVRAYMGLMIAGLGAWLLVGRQPRNFSWGRLVAVGALASVNKGLTGGGYGPLIAGGQIVAGLDPKAAVAVTNLAEAVVSLAAVGGYAWWFSGAWRWELVLAVTCGAVLAVPLGARTVRRAEAGRLRRWVAGVTVCLGLLVLTSVA
ncbi:MAG: sulfite exporter TauE/SafE family protein [Armatimonadota bacterium]|nr:sulfite exporter TauE/SafE family protein [Armatimonadota bacterium]MDW8156583.1 sulfite exporter TauE/SafE family protein [Armatimonadota bacterium]